jgi:succinate dehydrogenase/fumarate reductase cytochrome b subunit
MDKSLIEASFEFVYSISGCFFYFMNEKYFQYLNTFYNTSSSISMVEMSKLDTIECYSRLCT